MATFDFQLGAIRRSLGHTATHEAAYITAQRVRDERLGTIYDFTRKRGVLGFEIIGPAHMDAEWFGNTLELGESRANSVTARTVHVALPEEFSDEQRWLPLRRLGMLMWENFGLASLTVQHAAPHNRWSSGRNSHGHMLLSTRLMDAAGQLGKKVRAWDVKATSHLILRELRAYWARILNEALELAGFSARVDHRSLKDRGSLLLPRRHLRRGEYIASKTGGRESQYARDNRQIDAYNEKQKQLLTCLETQIHAARDAIRQRAYRTIESAKRAIANAGRRIAGFARAGRIAQHAIGKYRQRERRGSATLWQRVGQAVQRAVDCVPIPGRHSYRRDAGRTDGQTADGANHRADEGVRRADQPTQRPAPREGATPQEIAGLKAAEIIEHAKVEIDLAAWLRARGWREKHGEQESEKRLLIGPSGNHILATRVAVKSRLEWRYFDPDTRESGGIVEAVRKFAGIMDPAEIVSLLNDALLASFLPAAPANTLASFLSLAHRSAPSLGQSGKDYLASMLRLKTSTIEAFAHRLYETEIGSVRASHDSSGEAEESGYEGRSFVRGDDRGSGGGPRLFVAEPWGAEKFHYILLAESFENALAAWEMIPDAPRRLCTLIASTAGELTHLGVEKLRSMIAVLRSEQAGDETDFIYLIDASGSSDQNAGLARTEKLREVAHDTGVAYHRYAPDLNAGSWSSALISEKEAGSREAKEITENLAGGEELACDAAADLAAPETVTQEDVDNPPVEADDSNVVSPILPRPPRRR